jgi:hypothetical protein
MQNVGTYIYLTYSLLGYMEEKVIGQVTYFIVSDIWGSDVGEDADCCLLGYVILYPYTGYRCFGGECHVCL